MIFLRFWTINNHSKSEKKRFSGTPKTRLFHTFELPGPLRPTSGTLGAQKSRKITKKQQKTLQKHQEIIKKYEN